MIDRIAAKIGRELVEVPVGFKWFSSGLIDGSLAFGGEESAGASFLRRDGAVWTTDKDGLIMGLLAAELTARTGHDPNRFYASATQDLGRSFYERIHAPALSSPPNANDPSISPLLNHLKPTGTSMSLWSSIAATRSIMLLETTVLPMAPPRRHSGRFADK